MEDSSVISNNVCENSLRIEGVFIKYEPSSLNSFALKIDSIVLKPGVIYGVYGANGSGKTTLLKMLGGAISPARGSLLWFENSTPSAGKDFVMVTDVEPFQHWTVWENVYNTLKINGVSDKQAYKSTKEVLKSLGLLDLSKRYPHMLSTGQKQRTIFARGLALKPKLLLLDEVLSGQSEYWVYQITDILKNFVTDGGTVVIISHDPIWMVNNVGKVVHLTSEDNDDVTRTTFSIGFFDKANKWETYRKHRAESVNHE